jgi:F-type H+-transporting ATPase subunit delta
MAQQRAAIRYAKAILEINLREWLMVSDDMNLIASTIGGNLELSTLFKTPLKSRS